MYRHSYRQYVIPEEKRCQDTNSWCLQARMRDSEFCYVHTPGMMAEVKKEREANLNYHMERWISRPVNREDGLDAMPLSSRARNPLFRNGIRTIEALLQQSVRDLMGLRNMGAGTVSEVEEVLAMKNLSLQGRKGAFLIQTEQGWWEPARA